MYVSGSLMNAKERQQRFCIAPPSWSAAFWGLDVLYFVVLARKPPVEHVAHVEEVGGVVIDHGGVGPVGCEEIVAVEPLREAGSSAGATQIADAGGMGMARSPFGHDGCQGGLVVIEGGGAAYQNVLAAAAPEQVVAGAAD